MESVAAQQFATSIDPSSLQKLKGHSDDPTTRRAVAAQFASFLTQGLMRNADGSSMQMAEGVGADTVSSLFTSVVSQIAGSSSQLGLADVLLNAMPDKPATNGGTASTTAPATPAPAANGANAAAPAANASNGAAPNAAPAAVGAVPMQGFSLQTYRSGVHALLHGAAPPLSTMPSASRLTPGAPPMTAAPSGNSIPATQPEAASSAAASVSGAGASTSGTHQGPTTQGQGADARSRFIKNLEPLVADAARQLGVSPKVLLAQAALESGWGTSMPGNNLFGVKAGDSWNGGTVTASTQEVAANGTTVRQTDQFRAYPSLQAAIADYTKLIANHARYGAAQGTGDDAAAFGAALSRGGYASDPAYATKIAAIATSPAMANALGGGASSNLIATTTNAGGHDANGGRSA